MDAVRCLKCGETRWTLFGLAETRAETPACELCGGPTVRERRRPGRSRRGPLVERRDAVWTRAPSETPRATR